MNAEPIIIKPEQTSFLHVPELSEKIVQNLMNYGEVDMVGISSAIFLACGAVNMARNFAKVHVKSLVIDYINIPIVGKFDAIFFHLTKEQGIDFDTEIKRWDARLNEGGNQAAKIVTISKGERLEKLTTISLMKLSRYPLVKIAAAGLTINNAVAIALQLTRAGIAIHDVGVSFVGLNSIRQRNDPSKFTTALQIYIERGRKEISDSHHLALLEKMTTGK